MNVFSKSVIYPFKKHVSTGKRQSRKLVVSVSRWWEDGHFLSYSCLSIFNFSTVIHYFHDASGEKRCPHSSKAGARPGENDGSLDLSLEQRHVPPRSLKSLQLPSIPAGNSLWPGRAWTADLCAGCWIWWQLGLHKLKCRHQRGDTLHSALVTPYLDSTTCQNHWQTEAHWLCYVKLDCAVLKPGRGRLGGNDCSVLIWRCCSGLCKTWINQQKFQRSRYQPSIRREDRTRVGVVIQHTLPLEEQKQKLGGCLSQIIAMITLHHSTSIYWVLTMPTVTLDQHGTTEPSTTMDESYDLRCPVRQPPAMCDCQLFLDYDQEGYYIQSKEIN